MEKSANAFIKDIVNSPIGIKSGANLTDTINKLLIDNRCSSVAIDSPDNFVGIVTKTDLTKFYWKNHLGKNKVSNHMSVNYFSAFNNDALYDVIKTMLGFGISRMIITDRKRKPLGIILEI